MSMSSQRSEAKGKFGSSQSHRQKNWCRLVPGDISTPPESTNGGNGMVFGKPGKPGAGSKNGVIFGISMLDFWSVSSWNPL